MTAVEVDVWDLRHLLLSVDDRPRCPRDGDDLDRVMGRAVAALAGVAPRPPIRVPPELTAPVLVEALPLWIFETNAWLLAPDGPGGECLVVDVPPAPDRLVERIGRLGLCPVAVVLTHGHLDHAGGTGALLDALPVPVPVYVDAHDLDEVLHPAVEGVLARVAPGIRPPPPEAVFPLPGGAVLTVGGLTVRALHVPGHTAGSTCLLVEGGPVPLLFTGDTLFAGGTGRCDQRGSSRADADASLRALMAPLADDTVVLPGHGGITTIGRERERLHAPPSPQPLEAPV
jgi:hydroxyacylglutathione hydrolase